MADIDAVFLNYVTVSFRAFSLFKGGRSALKTIHLDISSVHYLKAIRNSVINLM